MGDHFSLMSVCMYVCVSVQACMGVCRVTAKDYLYTSRFGSELCASGQSLTVTEMLKHPGGTSNSNVGRMQQATEWLAQDM